MKGFKNSWILTEKGLEKTSLVYNELFEKIGDIECELEVLPEDYVVVPGFIDQHVHGAAGSDAMVLLTATLLLPADLPLISICTLLASGFKIICSIPSAFL